MYKTLRKKWENLHDISLAEFLDTDTKNTGHKSENR